MKTILEEEDIKIVVNSVVEKLKPFLVNQKEENAIFDKKSLAEYLKIKTSWIDKNLFTLPHFTTGKYIRFKQSSIDKWINSQEITPSSYLKLMKNSR